MPLPAPQRRCKDIPCSVIIRPPGFPSVFLRFLNRGAGSKMKDKLNIHPAFFRGSKNGFDKFSVRHVAKAKLYIAFGKRRCRNRERCRSTNPGIPQNGGAEDFFRFAKRQHFAARCGQFRQHMLPDKTGGSGYQTYFHPFSISPSAVKGFYPSLPRQHLPPARFLFPFRYHKGRNIPADWQTYAAAFRLRD